MPAGYGANVLVPLGISPLVHSWLIARIKVLQMGTVLTTSIIARFIDRVVFALFAKLSSWRASAADRLQPDRAVVENGTKKKTRFSTVVVES
jgi:hypothetical protein